GAIRESPSLEEIASHPDVDLVIVATSGKAGLLPTLASLRAGKIVALANKETLVMAGGIVMAEARKHKLEIRPIDSEHSAIWQCLQGEESNPIAQIILTASGGPLRNRSREELARVTAAEALRHPTWKMGRKVTIDSANLMNKGLEVIEAHWLFDVPFDRIKVMIHPGSIVHSMVEFADGSVKAQLGAPDMRLPIQYALSHPERWSNTELPKLDLDKLHSIKFDPVDLDRFPCLQLAIEAGRAGDTYPAVLSAADEVAVEHFLSGE
ncbi:MAG: 1-deoxy-D-xylulose-5-phosphate reductoisomerase, partial [Chloroflexi bacterium CG07_land_8_20_14_0_80_51_10]